MKSLVWGSLTLAPIMQHTNTILHKRSRATVVRRQSGIPGLVNRTAHQPGPGSALSVVMVSETGRCSPMKTA